MKHIHVWIFYNKIYNLHLKNRLREISFHAEKISINMEQLKGYILKG